MGCCSSGAMCGVCKAVGIVVTVLLLIATIAAAIGLYRAHMLPTGMMFGSVEGSLSLVAFVAALFGLKKSCKSVCGCSKGACGVCPGCGKSPCVCK